MSINLETRIEPLETEKRTADRRSFFIVPDQPAESGLGAEEAGQTLYKRTQTIHAWEPEIGYPAFIINSREAEDRVMLSTGLDLDGETAVWQINVYGQGSILHGQTTETGERWQLINRDNQGRLWQETTLWDEESPGLLTTFVMNAISKVSDLDATAAALIETRSANKIEYEDYRDVQKEKDKFGFGDKKLKDLLHKFVAAKFASHDAVSLQHMVEPNKDQYSRWQNIERLPLLVRKQLASTDFDVKVL